MHKQILLKFMVLFGLAALGWFLFLPSRVMASNPATISFQGKVVNSNGTNVTDGTYSFVFRIYNTSGPTMTTACTSTAACLWQETQASVSVTNGIFQVELGSSCALTSSSCNNTAGGPINFSSNSSLYLTLQFNGDTSGANGGFMSPLIHMNSVPFALQADNSASLGGVAAANYTQLNTSNTGSITITQGLTIGGSYNITVGSTSGSTIAACTGSQVVTGFQSLGGIVVAGTCSAQIGGGGSLATAYNSSGTSGNTIALSNSGGGVVLQDAASSTITNLFAVQNNGGTATYLAVTAANSGSIIVGNAANKITISSGSITTASGNLQVYGAGTTTVGNGTGAINLTAGTGSAISITALANSTWQVQGTSLTLDTQSGSNSTLTVSNSGAGNITLALDSGGVYAVGAATGQGVSCSAGQSLTAAAWTGGILTTTGTCAASSASLSGLSAASATNTIDNTNYQQTWDWELTSTTPGLSITEGTASTGSGALVKLATLASSTATPLLINNAGSANAFQVQDAGVVSLTVSASGTVLIGSATTDTTQILFQLDSFSTLADTATCSTTTNQGAMYYNTASNAVRGCINGSWEDMVSTGSLGLQLFGVVPDTGANPGDLAGVTSIINGPCKVYIGANTTTIAWNACTAFSGGRKVIVTAGTATVTTTNNNFQHLCLTGANNQPALSASGTEVANLGTVSYPSATAPILCLADIKTSASAISDVYETATYTTTTKEFATVITNAGALGHLVIQGTTTAGAVTPGVTLQGGSVVGVIVASTGATSTTTVNAIVAINGPAWVKAITETGNAVGNTIQETATTGYAGAFSSPTVTNTYSVLGLARTAWTGSGTCAANGLACSGSVLTNVSPR